MRQQNETYSYKHSVIISPIEVQFFIIIIYFV